MATYDVGIDLGTTNFRVYVQDNGIILDEPSVIAVDKKTRDVLAVGRQAHDMLGKNPSSIAVKYPLLGGAISDYRLNELMLKEFLKKASNNMIMKPQVCISVHTLMTDVEKRSVIDAAVAAGARKVYLIDEAIATAIGAGVDISIPRGVMIVNIGGGTIDAAVLSMNGVVCGDSVKYGGQSVDEFLIKKVHKDYKLHIGEVMAEEIKVNLGTAIKPMITNKYRIKGRSVVDGLPRSTLINQKEVFVPIQEMLNKVIETIKGLLEQTPPELSGDIYTRGIILTGGSAQLKGIDEYITKALNMKTTIPQNPADCVSYGTGKAFDMATELSAGFIDATNFMHKRVLKVNLFKRN